ncbi:glutathione peroxidase [Nocardioides pantholopis]|uniref:glutathione peroxidase n=1 Tax=Nocardioides pantholopis TaxID=2483798 RepID=UPI000FDC3F0B|nr:glutathione peroxidase [Nocardioides pantholopis]
MSILEAPIGRLDGTPATLGELTGGRPALVVNVASKCGLTPQYAGLEKLQEQYADRGFTVVGVPCNQFMGQEPGSPEEIAEFCSSTYGVTFPMTEKVEVNGEGRHPLYETLVTTPNEAGEAGDVQWNFEKFLLAADGTVVARFSPRVEPEDPALVDAVERLVS